MQNAKNAQDQITDKNIIENIKNDFDDIHDGLMIFVSQGKYLIDMCLFTSGSINLYEITIIERFEDALINDAFINYSYLDNASIDEFDVENAKREYYGNSAAAHLRISQLIAELNHF